MSIRYAQTGEPSARFEDMEPSPLREKCHVVKATWALGVEFEMAGILTSLICKVQFQTPFPGDRNSTEWLAFGLLSACSSL